MRSARRSGGGRDAREIRAPHCAACCFTSRRRNPARLLTDRSERREALYEMVLKDLPSRESPAAECRAVTEQLRVKLKSTLFEKALCLLEAAEQRGVGRLMRTPNFLNNNLK